jgi:biopolymer transport protein ExbD
MARAKKNRQQKEADIPISAMIDIVFLLIIFFVVTATIDKDLLDEKVLLADAPHGKPQSQKNPLSVTINVRADGEINIGMAKMSKKQVSSVLKDAASRWGNDFPIIIRGDKDAQHHYIQEVMTAVTDTGLYKVKFNAEVK